MGLNDIMSYKNGFIEMNVEPSLLNSTEMSIICKKKKSVETLIILKSPRYGKYNVHGYLQIMT